MEKYSSIQTFILPEDITSGIHRVAMGPHGKWIHDVYDMLLLFENKGRIDTIRRRRRERERERDEKERERGRGKMNQMREVF